MRPCCSGCGRTDVPTQAYRCEWPDHLITLDRHCSDCERIWHAQLRSLGARLEPIEPRMMPVTDHSPVTGQERKLADAVGR
jgi:hypothetical protein